MRTGGSQRDIIGEKKYREKIHKASKLADEKNLPYRVLPKRRKISNNLCYQCPCGQAHYLNRTTVMTTCHNCNILVKVSDMILVESELLTPQVNMSNYKGQETKPAPY